jgi:hypothetical protein
MHPTAACHDTRDCVRVVTNSAPERSISDDRLRLPLPAPDLGQSRQARSRRLCLDNKRRKSGTALGADDAADQESLRSGTNAFKRPFVEN